MNTSRMRLLALGAAVLALAGATGARAEVYLLDADPPGSYLAVSGPLTLAGAAPLPIDDLPLGEYRLHAEGPGWAAGRGRLVRSAQGLAGRPWASPAALLQPPGLTHLQRGEQRGWSLLGAGSVSAAMAAYSQLSVRDAQDRLDEAEQAYARSVSVEEIGAARRRLTGATQEVQDQEEIRDLWLGYLGATWVGAAIEGLWLTPRPRVTAEAAGVYRVAVPRGGRIQAALRSALVPGAGQRALWRDRRGSAFFAAIAALGAGAIATHESFLDARRDQAEAQRIFDEARDEAQLRDARERLEEASDRTDDRDALRWALVGAAAGVYLWNVLDAYGLDPEASGARDLSWSVVPAADGAYVCATWSVR